MRFVFKLIFLGFVGLALVPAIAPVSYRADAGTNEDRAAPNMFELASVVGATISDIRGLCDRRPDVCETGGEMISYAASQAREGLVIAYSVFRHGHPSMQETEKGPSIPAPRPAALVGSRTAD